MGRASACAQCLRMRADTPSGPVPESSRILAMRAFARRVRIGRKPDCLWSHTVGERVNMLSIASGRCDFDEKVSARSSAFVSGEIAHAPSDVFSGGTVDCRDTCISKDFDKDHHCLDHAGSCSKRSLIRPVCNLNSSSKPAEHKSRCSSNCGVPKAMHLFAMSFLQRSFIQG